MSNPLLDTQLWFEQAVPEPEVRNVNAQTGCHFEEVFEMLDEMVGTTTESYKLINEARTAIKRLADHLKSAGEPLAYSVANHTKFLDALCDQVVTAVGTSHMHGYDTQGAMIEVNASNFSKFVDGKPVFNENNKIMKGPDYFEANLEPFASNPRF